MQPFPASFSKSANFFEFVFKPEFLICRSGPEPPDRHNVKIFLVVMLSHKSRKSKIFVSAYVPPSVLQARGVNCCLTLFNIVVTVCMSGPQA